MTYTHLNFRNTFTKVSATLAIITVLCSPASAVVVSVNGSQYDLQIFDGPFLGNESLFSSVAPGEMPWWGNETSAIDFATQVFDQLLEGSTPGNSPLFAFEKAISDVNGWSSDITNPNVLYSESFDIATTAKYVTAKEVPGPTPIIGMYAAFAFSRKLRRRLKSINRNMDT